MASLVQRVEAQQTHEVQQKPSAARHLCSKHGACVGLFGSWEKHVDLPKATDIRYQLTNLKTNPGFSKGLGKKRKTLSHQTIMNEHLQYPLLIGILRVPPT